MRYIKVKTENSFSDDAISSVRLFVYGIFLGENTRIEYGLTNPTYTTVKGFKTVGNYIVRAEFDKDATVTGLLTEVKPSSFKELDSLESGYSRELVETTDGSTAYMYISPDSVEQYKKWKGGNNK